MELSYDATPHRDQTEILDDFDKIIHNINSSPFGGTEEEIKQSLHNLIRELTNSFQRTPMAEGYILSSIIDTGNSVLVEFILDLGIPVTARDPSRSCSALYNTLRRAMYNIASILIAHGAVLPPEESAAALVSAVDTDDMELLDFMLDLGVDLDKQDSAGWTPLAYAAIANNPEAIKKLVEHGASLYARTESERTPLMEAVMYEPLDGRGFTLVGMDLLMLYKLKDIIKPVSPAEDFCGEKEEEQC